MGNIYAPPVEASHRKALVVGVLCVAAFLAVEALLLRSFIRTDTRPPAWDQAIHLEIALDYREALAQGKVAEAWHLAPKPGMPAFPPAYHLLIKGAYDSADPARAALWVNWFYLALLAAAIFGIGWHFRHDETPLIAVLLFLPAPAVQELLVNQLVDLPVLALAAAAYWALLAADGFRNWVPSVLFGLAHAAGMLHKWSFFSYMLPAYFVAARALGDRKSLGPLLVSAAISAGLTAPWYAAHLALLPSRLVQASSDFGVSFLRPSAWTAYLSLGADGLGPVFFAMGAMGLLTPQYARRREHGWILLAWFAAAYLFWTIVPNRQLRFLLPGLVPLAIGFCSTWPKAASWAIAALQLVGLFNFHAGWFGPVPVTLGGTTVKFFVVGPAAREDWKHEEILRRIDAERDPSRPFANATIIANHESFNATNLHWLQRRLGLSGVRLRSVNRRLSELSEFVILKDGKLGHASVVGALPEAAVEASAKDGWFARAYEELARWPLPDGTNAVLFRQRRNMPKPFSGKRLVYQIYTAGRLEARDLKVEFGPWVPSRSAYETVTLTAERLSLRGLVARGLDATLEDAGLIPIYEAGRPDEWADARLLRLGRLKLRALSIGADEVKVFLAERVKGLQVSEVVLDKTVRVAGRLHGRPVEAEAALELLDSPRRLKVEILSASYAGSGVPLGLFREIKELTIPLEPSPETPFHIELPGLTIAGGRLTIP